MTAETEHGWRSPERHPAAAVGIAAARAGLHRSTIDRADPAGVTWRASCLCGKAYTGSFEFAEKWATRHPEWDA